MYAVKAIYDGANFQLKQPISIEGKYEVIITFIEPFRENSVADEPPKVLPLSELKGLLKGKVWMSEDFNEPLEEMKEYM